jgi:hypothetical protein
VFSGCGPQGPSCTGNARRRRSPVRVTRTVVRPNSKNGGTTVLFRLSRPTALRITVVRVYPTCKRVGSFTVRARAGVNRIRFRGRLGGRALPEGGYRLVVRARGAQRDAAAVPIVIARGAMSPAALRKARATIVCGEPIADFDATAVVLAGAAGNDDEASGGGVLGKIKSRLKAPLASAGGAIADTARALTRRVNETSDDPVSRFVLTLIGAIALASSILGAVVLTRIVRTDGFRRA